MCDEFVWKYNDSSSLNYIRIVRHRRCELIEYENISNVQISENGSLIIYNVTPENDGVYRVDINDHTGRPIQTDEYTVHVEVPVSVPVLNVSCLQNGSAEISCRVEEGTKPNIHLSVIGGSRVNYSASSNKITVIVESPEPWSITCYVKNGVSQRNESRVGVTCPVPLSDINVTSSCLENGSAEVECSVNGSDPHYFWSLDGTFVSSHSRVTLPRPVSGILRCDVTSQISNLSRSINISCTAPLSYINVTSSCPGNGSAEAECSVNGSDPRYSWSLDGTFVSSHSRVTLPLPVSGILRCDVTNQISNLSRSINISCTGRSGWGHLLSPGAVCVLYTTLLICIVIDLRKMKNEMNRSERRTRRRDQTEMEMEAT